MKKYLAPGSILVIAIVAMICRIASGGEAATMTVISDSLGWFRTLADYGALGSFLWYMIWEKKTELVRQKEERDQRVKDNERWHALDRELVELVKENTRVNSETVAALHNINAEMRRLTSTSGPTRVYNKE